MLESRFQSWVKGVNLKNGKIDVFGWKGTVNRVGLADLINGDRAYCLEGGEYFMFLRSAKDAAPYYI